MWKNNVTQIMSKYIISSLCVEVYTFYGILSITFGTPLVFTYIAAMIFVPIGTVRRRGLKNVQQEPSLLQLLLKKGLWLSEDRLSHRVVSYSTTQPRAMQSRGGVNSGEKKRRRTPWTTASSITSQWVGRCSCRCFEPSSQMRGYAAVHPTYLSP